MGSGLFNLAACVVLLAIGRTLTTDRRVPWLMVFAFQCVKLGRGGLPVAAGAHVRHRPRRAAVVLRWLRPTRVEIGPGRGRSWRARVVDGLPDAPAVGGSARVAVLTVFVVLLAVATATHQLSPYLVAVDVLVLAWSGW